MKSNTQQKTITTAQTYISTTQPQEIINEQRNNANKQANNNTDTKSQLFVWTDRGMNLVNMHACTSSHNKCIIIAGFYVTRDHGTRCYAGLFLLAFKRSVTISFCFQPCPLQECPLKHPHTNQLQQTISTTHPRTNQHKKYFQQALTQLKQTTYTKQDKTYNKRANMSNNDTQHTDQTQRNMYTFQEFINRQRNKTQHSHATQQIYIYIYTKQTNITPDPRHKLVHAKTTQLSQNQRFLYVWTNRGITSCV